MSDSKPSLNPAMQFFSTTLKWSWLWIGTAMLFGLIGFGYVKWLKKDVWVASQGLMVRDEANGAVMRLGRFQSQADMKAAQETIIELSRNPQVIHHALVKVGPEPSFLGKASDANWPTAKDIELATKKIEVRAPRGAELGTTEVIYLDTKHSSRSRAYELNLAVCDSLVERLQEVRRLRADGVLAELKTARDVASAELLVVTDKLQAIERRAGEDLSDLRGMTDAGSNTNSARLQLDVVKAELRQAETQLQQMLSDLELAEKAFASPEQLLSPNSLVNSQPGLRKLREGLADARINASQLQGRFTEQHPLVIAAIKAEQEIQVHLREELGLARQTLVNDTSLIKKRMESLQRQQDLLSKRIEGMADVRAEYANLIAEVRSRSQVLQDTERQLSEVQAARDAAVSCSLVTRIDNPFASETPVGPGRATILAGSTMAGLFFGFGALFLLAPLETTGSGRRANDFASAVGRRASDRVPGLRSTDSVVISMNEPSLSAVASAPPTADNRSQSPSGISRLRRTADPSGSGRIPAAPPATTGTASAVASAKATGTNVAATNVAAPEADSAEKTAVKAAVKPTVEATTELVEEKPTPVAEGAQPDAETKRKPLPPTTPRPR